MSVGVLSEKGDKPGRELKKDLGLKEVVATVMTSVIGGGLFLTTVQIQEEVPVGSNVIFSYLLAALPAFFVALSYAVLSSAIPSSGGDYIYISRIVDPTTGFLVTWVRWFGMVAGISAISIGDLALISNMFTAVGWDSARFFIVHYRIPLAIAVILTFLTVNYLGVKIYGRVQDIMFLLLLSGILLYIVAGLPHVRPEYLTSSARGGLQDVLRASSIVFFSYIGFAAIADAGGEVKNAKRTLPRGIVISVVLIAVFYVLVATITYGTAPLDAVTEAGNVPAAAMLFLPSFISLYISFTAFIALVSDINPSILATSRLSFAWAKDKVVPHRLSELSRFHTPKWTLAMNGAIAIFIVLAFSEFIEAIDVTTIAILMTYAAVCLATFVMPYKRPDLWKKAEVKYRGTWLISLLGLVTTLLLLGYLVQVSLFQFLVVVVWMGIGGLVYHMTREKHELDRRIISEKMRALREMEEWVVLFTKHSGKEKK